MKRSKLAMSLVSIFAVAAIGTPAIAADDENALRVRSETVAFGDLDLEKDQGAQVLYRRLKYASEKVCNIPAIQNSRRGVASAKKSLEARRCYQNTMTAAVNTINNENLTKIVASNDPSIKEEDLTAPQVAKLQTANTN